MRLKQLMKRDPGLEIFGIGEKNEEEFLKTIQRSYYPAINVIAGYSYGVYNE